MGVGVCVHAHVNMAFELLLNPYTQVKVLSKWSLQSICSTLVSWLMTMAGWRPYTWHLDLTQY